MLKLIFNKDHIFYFEKKENLFSVLAEAGLTQTQRDPTRGENLLDLFCCNKPSIVKTCISIPGISDHSIVLADYN